MTTSPSKVVPENSQAVLRRLSWRIHHAVENVLSGDYRSVFRGRGMEFEQVVKYTFGDDMRDIDWKVTARLGEPYRKKFVEERELTVIVLFEDSPSLRFGSGARAKRAALHELAALIMLLGSENRDRVGFVHATPEGYDFHPPACGRNAILHATSILLEKPEPAFSKKPAVIPWKLLFRAATKHSVLLWLGDFPPRERPAPWRMLQRRFTTAGFRVEDRWERQLPSGETLAAYDPTAERIVPLDDSAEQNEARRDWNHRRDQCWHLLFPNALSRMSLTADDDTLVALVKFFHRQLNARHR